MCDSEQTLALAANDPSGDITKGPMPTLSSALVLGFGNVLLGDDGAGVRLMERLRTEVDAECVDGGTMSFTLLAHVEVAESMLVIDAANIGQAPGSIELFVGAAMDDFLLGTRRRTVHEVGLVDLLDMARLLGCLPERRALLCLQPERIDWSTALSVPVERSLGTATALAKTLLQHWQHA
jgi:hydrogenase maturation protease